MADMGDEIGQTHQAAYDSLPPETVTGNQLVAYNIAHYRRGKGMTQEELGVLLEQRTGRPWSKATVSAAERSWDGRRIRQFDADELLALSEVLDVPLPAFFLPPTDDGVSRRYGIKTNAAGYGYGAFSVRDLLDYIVPAMGEFSGDDDPPNYVDAIERLHSAMKFHFGASWERTMQLANAIADSDDAKLRHRKDELLERRMLFRGLLGELNRESELVDELLAKASDEKGSGQPGKVDGYLTRLGAAMGRGEDAVLLHDLSSLAHEVPDNCDRDQSQLLMRHLISLLGNDRTVCKSLRDSVGEAMQRATDYRTPWYKLGTEARVLLEKNVDLSFAQRMAARINQGEEPADVAESVGMKPYILNIVINRNRVKVRSDANWPPFPGSDEDAA